MATSRLSKEAEIKITDALSEVSELVNSGIQPNEAIAKTASDNGIPVGHIELMVRAFNVGRSEAQRHSGAEPHEKLAEFELADLKSVMDIMYPSSVKSASVLAKDASISDAYGKPPVKSKPELPPLPPLMPMTKSASVGSKTSEITRDTLGSVRALSSLIEKIGSASDKLRTDSANTRDRVMQGVSKLASYFRTYGGKPFMVVKDNSERLFGKKASALLNIILSANRQLKKQAGTVEDLMSPVNLDEEPYSSIKNCIDLADIHLNKQASSEYLKKLAKQAMSTGFAESLPNDNTGSVLDGIDKQAAGASSSTSSNPIKDFRSSLIGMIPRPSLKKRDYESTIPEDTKDYKFIADQRLQDMTLKNIRASAALSDLMSNDEIISSHHPEDIAFHFNEIGKVMPESVTNVAIMRPILRQRLVGGMNAIAPTDIKAMLEMEEHKKPLALKSAAYGSGNIDPFKLRMDEARRREVLSRSKQSPKKEEKKPEPEPRPKPEPKPEQKPEEKKTEQKKEDKKKDKPESFLRNMFSGLPSWDGPSKPKAPSSPPKKPTIHPL